MILALKNFNLWQKPRSKSLCTFWESCRKRTLYRAREWTHLTLGNEQPEETCADKAGDLIGSKHPGKRAESRVKRPWRIALPQGSPSQALWKGVSFQIVSGQSPCLAHICSDSESFLVMPASLSQDGFQREELWEIGHLLPPKFSHLAPVFSGNTKFLIETSCCEEASRPGQSWWFQLPVS